MSRVQLSASGTFQATIGSGITFNCWADPTNTQGADAAGNTPGTLLHTFSTTTTGTVQSFSTNAVTPIMATGPFFMTEEATYTSQPLGELLSRGLNMVAVNTPELSTWVMMALGFVGLGFAGYRFQRKKNCASRPKRDGGLMISVFQNQKRPPRGGLSITFGGRR